MFISREGSVTGSIHWAELEDIVANKRDESVTKAGYKRLSELLAEHRAAQPEPAPAQEPEDPEEPEEPEADSEEELDPAELKGAALTEALAGAGLPTSGTADEKRARLAEHVSKEE